MSLQKKNVIQGFLREEYVPSGKQYLVKYLSGKGNNLHEVECFDGSVRLVSMPKKYRQTVWLKRDDCLVIDPIEEGKKVTGEIMCLLPDHAVRDLITSRQWPTESTSSDSKTETSTDIDALLKFFDRNSEKQAKREEYNPFPPSDSSELDTEEEEDEEDGDEDDEEEDEDNGEEEEDQEEEETVQR